MASQPPASPSHQPEEGVLYSPYFTCCPTGRRLPANCQRPPPTRQMQAALIPHCPCCCADGVAFVGFAADLALVQQLHELEATRWGTSRRAACLWAPGQAWKDPWAALHSALRFAALLGRALQTGSALHPTPAHVTPLRLCSGKEALNALYKAASLLQQNIQVGARCTLSHAAWCRPLSNCRQALCALSPGHSRLVCTIFRPPTPPSICQSGRACPPPLAAYHQLLQPPGPGIRLHVPQRAAAQHAGRGAQGCGHSEGAGREQYWGEHEAQQGRGKSSWGGFWHGIF